MARINLAPNPSFKTDATGWTPLASSSILRTSDTAFFGDHSLQITNSSTGLYGVRTTNITGFTAGLDYSFSVYVYLPDNVSSTEYYNDIEMKVVFYNSSNETIGSTSPTSGVHKVYDSDYWSDNRLSIVTEAPAGVSYAIATITAQAGVTAASELFYLDALLVEQASKVNEYFDQLSDTPANEQGKEKELVNRALTPTPIPHITGPELNADISLGRLVFNTVDEDGTVWVCTDLVGWWGQSSPDVPDITRGTEDGSFDVSGRYMARVITLSGVFLPQSREYLPKALNRLITETDLVRRTSILRVDEDPTKIATVRLVGQPVISTVNARGRTDFSITLRAADPIKYGWADNQVHGYDLVDINGLVPIDEVSPTGALKDAPVINEGNATVTSTITVVGPIGSGSSIRALSRNRDETITLVSALRDAGNVAKATSYARDNLIVTITTDADHGLLVGDTIQIRGSGATLFPYIDPQQGNHVVTAVTDLEPFTFSYSLENVQLIDGDTGQDFISTLLSADVVLTLPDTLIIDTYNKEVLFNGTSLGQRSKLEPLVDWVKFDPGTTTVTLTDSFDNYTVVSKSYTRTGTSASATLKFNRAHFLKQGDTVNVFLPETIDISTGAAVAATDVVTITTDGAHGYGVGDKVRVTIDETKNVTFKAYTASTNMVELTLNENHSWADGADIQVTLPSSAEAQNYTYNTDTNVATVNTRAAHGFVAGDVISVSDPALSSIQTKSMASGVATVTTRTAHGLATGGDALVSLPETATLNLKTVSGLSVLMSTTTNHGFVVSDRVSISLPISANVSNFAFGGFATHRVTVTTDAPHGFSVGDSVTVAFPSYAAFDGTYFIESTTNDTFTFYYFKSTSAITSTATTGSVSNLSNAPLNGTYAIESIPTPTTFTYTKAS